MDVSLLRQIYQDQVRSLQADVSRLQTEKAEITELLAKALEDKSAAESRCEMLEKTLFSAAEKFLISSAPSGKSDRRSGSAGYRSGNKVSHDIDGSAVYFIYCEPAGAVKIGVSVDVASRFSALQTGNPYKLSLVGCIPGSYSEESVLHKFFKKAWTGVSEWFFYDTSPLFKCYVREAVEAKIFIDPAPWYKEKVRANDTWFYRWEKKRPAKPEKAAQLRSADLYLEDVLSLPATQERSTFLLRGA